jgi:glycine/D-amino acid oxidase-like deaminating enzyme
MVSILIIGAGFAGAASAYFLSQLPGVQIRLVEREESFGLHASGKNAAMLRQAVPDLQTAQWIQETLAFLQNPPPDGWEDSLYQKTGSLLLGPSQKLRDLDQILREVGGQAQWISPQGSLSPMPPWLQGIFPAGDKGEVLYCPDDGVIQLQSFLNYLLSSAKKRGVEIFYRSEVTAIRLVGEVWEVDHGEKKFFADGIVNGAGAWCDRLLRMAGLPPLNLTAYRRHLFKSRGWNFSNDGLPLVWDVGREVYFRPDEDELMLSPGDESPHPSTDPLVDPQAEAWLRKKLRDAFPGLGIPPLADAWACLRTKGMDGKMYVNQLHEKPGYFCISGLGGHGVGASMGLGRMIQNLITYWLAGKKGLQNFG